ncbi:MAG: metal-dependent hydrolase [Chloroflexota bacterium]
MNGRSHAILGAATSTLALAFRGVDILEEPFLFIPVLIVGVLASLLPDIDSANNLFRKSLKLSSKQTLRDVRRTPITRPVSLIIAVARFIIARILNLLDRFLPHRGPTHYGITALFLTWVVFWICGAWDLPDEYWFVFGAGYVSHLIGDGVTIRGVRLLAPFYDPAVHLVPRPLRIRVGTQAENVMLALLVGIIFWVYLTYLGLITLEF